MIGVVKDSQNAQIEIEQKLQGLDPSALVQEATLPTKHVTPKRSLIAIMSALITGFALFLFVFIRQIFLRNASQDSEYAEKLAALKIGWQKVLGRAK